MSDKTKEFIELAMEVWPHALNEGVREALTHALAPYTWGLHREQYIDTAKRVLTAFSDRPTYADLSRYETFVVEERRA